MQSANGSMPVLCTTGTICCSKTEHRIKTRIDPWKRAVIAAVLMIVLGLSVKTEAFADTVTGTASAETLLVLGSAETESSNAALIGSAGSSQESMGSLGQQVISYASQFIGNPYRWGGTSLTNGADCSGFLMSIYRNFGVSLPHSSSAMAGVGTQVSGLGNAVPGDILVYAGHCGIYLGNGRMLSALNSSTGIIISSASYKAIKAIRRVL